MTDGGSFVNDRWLIKQLEKMENVTDWRLSCSSCVLHEISLRHDIDMKRYVSPNRIKQASSLAFWIKKLKPVHRIDGLKSYVNEVFAFHCINAVLEREYLVPSTIPASFMTEFLYSMRYRSMSPQNIDFMLKVLYLRRQRQS